MSMCNTPLNHMEGSGVPDSVTVAPELRDSRRSRWAKAIPVMVRSATLLQLASSLSPAEATFSLSRCCVVAVRHNLSLYSQDSMPWAICNFNRDIDWSNTSATYDSVSVTLSWAKEHCTEYCSGFILSTLRQWLIPLVTYISPYIGILLLCPVGDDITRIPNNNKNGIVQGLVAALNLVLQYVQEYVSILGDPASAIFGAFSEVIGDAVSVRRIAQSMQISESRPEEIPPERTREERVLWVSVLAGQLKFNKETNWKSVAEDILSPPMSPAITTDTQHPQRQQGHDLISTTPSPSPPIDSKTFDEVKPSEKLLPTSTVSSDNTTARHSKATELDKAIAVLLVARGKFSMGILIPVILMLAATAAAFYDAYSRLGDRDTSLALAYCVWYSWLLILGVWGNCYAAAMNSDLARRAFSEIVHFGNERAVTVSLRDRYVNSQFWDSWAKKMSGRRESFNSDKTQSDMDNNPLTWKSWLHFCIGQFLGWCCVGVPSGAAAAIAWNTPTIGLGCRAFNVLLYGVLSFAIAYLNVLRSWLVLRDKVKKPEHSEKGYRQASTHYVSHIYWLLTFLNSMVMVLGTIFHLIGVFRTCWCDRLVWTDDTRIELNNRTHESLDHAKRYWLSTAYVSFSIVSLISLVGIVLRHNIAQTMGDWIDRCNRDEQRRREEADRLTQITRLTSGGAQIG